MKWYFAARTKHKDAIKIASNILKKSGQNLTFDWTGIESLKPYDKNAQKCGEVASQMHKSILKSDIFVLISDSGGTDMFVELGIAIANLESCGKPKIYIVGEHGMRSFMHLYPKIQHLSSLSKVFLEEGIKVDEKDLAELSNYIN